MRPRGRPKTSEISTLILLGKNSDSHIKCEFCGRTFPRMKGLNTHRLIHKEVKNYRCSFPSCTKSFTQSSQLKSHLCLHTKEKPFICPGKGCKMRYVHSHRICPIHPDLKLIKQLETTEVLRTKFYRDSQNISETESKWFDEFLLERGEKLQAAVQFQEKSKMEEGAAFFNFVDIMRGACILAELRCKISVAHF